MMFVWKCDDCDNRFGSVKIATRCPHCNSENIKLQPKSTWTFRTLGYTSIGSRTIDNPVAVASLLTPFVDEKAKVPKLLVSNYSKYVNSLQRRLSGCYRYPFTLFTRTEDIGFEYIELYVQSKYGAFAFGTKPWNLDYWIERYSANNVMFIPVNGTTFKYVLDKAAEFKLRGEI